MCYAAENLHFLPGFMQIHTPDWVKHAIFYQIFPDRFAKGNQFKPSLLSNPQWEDWDASPTLQGYKGGDLWGVLEKLDHIENLGVNAIYFTPIFQSGSNHRYHTHDYYQVDPLLGGNGAFRELLNEAHKRNIKIVLDGVFNHASRGIFFFHDILENGPNSPWVDWFKIQDWPLAPYTNDAPANYESWADIRSLPVFNHDHPDVREYIMQIAEYWIEFGIDGWRLDVPDEIKTPGFWQEFRERVKAINPDAYIVGEVWGDSRQWLDGTQFDGVMNYLFTGPTIAFTVGNRIELEMIEGRAYEAFPPLSAAEYAEKMQELLNLYPWEIQLTQLNLLASHDTARLISIAGGDITSVELATLLLLTFPGSPSIYYGDEVGLPGGLDPDCRRGFPIIDKWNLEILKTHKQLISLRHQYAALRIGDYQVIYADTTLYVFVRSWEDQQLMIAINIGEDGVRASLDSYKPAKLLYGNGEVLWSGEKIEINIPARSGAIFG